MPQKLHFQVSEVSGQDEYSTGVDLNHHSPTMRGWVSERFCQFPQSLVFALEQPAQLCKIQILSHEYLIASKVEIFVGNIANQLEPLAYQRLGYVTLSKNENTGLKARELKSIHVDARGTHIKMLLHKPHPNDRNSYGQVSLIAVNIIGDTLDSISNFDSANLNLEKANVVPLTEDLAFDVYQDPEVARVIRMLQSQKRTAVLNERFDDAERLRDIIVHLQKVGEHLGRLTLEKQRAIDEEDYAHAKLKNFQLHEIRTGLHRDAVLSKLFVSTTNGMSPIAIDPSPKSVQSSQPDSPGQNHSTSPRSHSTKRSVSSTPNECQNNNNAVIELDDVEGALKAVKLSSLRPHLSPPLPVAVWTPNASSPAGGQIDEKCDAHAGAEEEVPGVLSISQQHQASVAIDVVGLDLVTKAMSKQWKFREQALMELQQRILHSFNSISTDPCNDYLPNQLDQQAELRSSTFLLKRGLQDQVLSVFRLSTSLIHEIVILFCERHGIPRVEMLYALDKLIPVIFHRIGDTSVRIRDVAKQHLIHMSGWPQIRHYSTFWHELLSPLPSVTLDRMALGRMELVIDLYSTRAVSPSSRAAGASDDRSRQSTPTTNGFTLDALCTFTAKALTHKSSEVRESAETLMVALYRSENRRIVRSSLPSDCVTTRKQPLYKRLFGKFENIDQKYCPMASVGSCGDVVDEELLSIADSNQPIDLSTFTTNSKLNPAPKDHRTVPKVSNDCSSPTLDSINQGQPLLTNLDRTCIFCGEKNYNFTEEGLDSHYWNNCPMLTRCMHCNLVVEIADLNDHILSECAAVRPGQYSRCPKCSEIVETSSHPCHPPDPDSIRCPLCHSDLPLPNKSVLTTDLIEEIWKSHLLALDLSTTTPCLQNPRKPPHTMTLEPPSPAPSITYDLRSIKHGGTYRILPDCTPTRSGIPRLVHPS